MMAAVFDSLREGGAACPSDLALDRLIASELAPTAIASIEQHLGGCEICSGRVAQRRAGFEATSVDPRSMLAKIRTKIDQPESTLDRTRAWISRRAYLVTALAAGVVAISIAVPSAPPVDGTRTKGAPVLHVHRLGEKASEEVKSGSHFAPGDKIRFVIDLPVEAHVKIVGVENGGRLYEAWPLRDQTTETLRRAGDGQVLPGALSLDRTAGRETLYLVACPPEIGAAQCTSRGAGVAPACTEGCAISAFVMEKGP
jgi:hypothetical protein